MRADSKKAANAIGWRSLLIGISAESLVESAIRLWHPKEYKQVWGRATSEHGFALVYQPLGFGLGNSPLKWH